MTKPPELKPCQFCSGAKVYVRTIMQEADIFCPECEANGPVHDSEAEAIAAWNTRATPPEVTALVAASTALRDHIARWHDGGPVAGPDESRALFEALDDALAKWEAANA